MQSAQVFWMCIIYICKWGRKNRPLKKINQKKKEPRACLNIDKTHTGALLDGSKKQKHQTSIFRNMKKAITGDNINTIWKETEKHPERLQHFHAQSSHFLHATNDTIINIFLPVLNLIIFTGPHQFWPSPLFIKPSKLQRVHPSILSNSDDSPDSVTHRWVDSTELGEPEQVFNPLSDQLDIQA